jgi:hypothetical protein
MAETLFNTEDVIKAFPWISMQTLHHRIKQGFLPIKHRSRIRGIPNRFTKAELIHVGVQDIQATLGLFKDIKRVSAEVWTNATYKAVSPILEVYDPNAPPKFTPFTLNGPFDLDLVLELYEFYNYNLIVRIDTNYGETGRDYSITYLPAPAQNPKKPSVIQQQCADWEKSKTYGEKLSLTLISVLRVFQEANHNLSLRLKE